MSAIGDGFLFVVPDALRNIRNSGQSNKMKISAPPTGPYTVVYAKQLYSTRGQKSLEEARGYAVAEYQDYLEKQWNERMRKEYLLKVNEKVFESMVKK